MKNQTFNFQIIQEDKNSNARSGIVTTPHGVIETPAFVPVGTQATVKSLTSQDLKNIGVQVLFGNTYHLHLRPGEDVVGEFGGLGKFMGWNGPTMTDSGGFQVFSLEKKREALKGPTFRLLKVGPSSRNDEGEPRLVKITSSPPRKSAGFSPLKEDVFLPRFIPASSGGVFLKRRITDNGVTFRSHIDGSLHTFTPEKSIEIQKKLGADIILAFDECIPYPSSYEYSKEAMERTHTWALRSLKASQGKLYYPWKQALFGIVQGGVYKDLREESARFISSLPFDGIAIGGVSVGESKSEMRNVLDWVVPFLPDNKPRHLLGIGEVDDIFDAIERGIDTFDCVIPTRLGRTGFVFVSPPEGNIKNRFRVDITKAKFAANQNPPDSKCNCYVCSNFTRGYLNHLFRTKELLAYRLASYHNVYFITYLVDTIRAAIFNQQFVLLKQEWMV